MPVAKVQMPDGRIARFEVPEGTTPEQVLAYAETMQQQKPDTGAKKNQPIKAAALSLASGQIPFGQRISSGLAAGALAPFLGQEGENIAQTASRLYGEAQDYTKQMQELNPTASGVGTGIGALSTIPAAFSKAPITGTNAIAALARPMKGLIDVGNKVAGVKPFAGAGMLSGAGNLAARSLGTAAVAAPTAALYAAGEAPEGEMLQRGAEGAGMGAAVGAALPIAVKGVGAVLRPIDTAIGLSKLLNNITDDVAQGISKKIVRSDLPEELAKSKMGDAELLFIKTLMDEGVSLRQAKNSLEVAKKYGATPSVGVTANIPQMQTQGYLMSRGSSGSRVAAKAIEEIDNLQIPSLNKRLVETATGGKQMPAEDYGKIVAEEAKKIVNAQATRLKTRASPYYAKSVGVDKSVPINSPEMKKALANNLAVKALNDARVDPYTLTNTAKELAEYGVDAGDLAKLPYNSTVSLHAARVQLRGMGEAAIRAGEKTKYAAIKTAIDDIDGAIESAFPDYATARKIYSEDAGAFRALKDSPIGKMSEVVDGDYSKIASDIMSKDPKYINKFIAKLGDNQKVRDAVAGAYLKRQLEVTANEGRRFSDAVFKNEMARERLKALVGDARFAKMEKIDKIIDDLLKTRNIPAQSITAAAQSVKEGTDLPINKADIVNAVRKKISPSLFELVQKNPEAAARYNELLFTDEGYALLNKILSKTKKSSQSEVNAVADFLNKNAKKIIEDETGAVKLNVNNAQNKFSFNKTWIKKIYPQEIEILRGRLNFYKRSIEELKKEGRSYDFLQKSESDLEKKIEKMSKPMRQKFPKKIQIKDGSYYDSAEKIAEGLEALYPGDIETIVEKSKKSESAYLYINNLKEDKQIKIRFSDHKNRYRDYTYNVGQDIKWLEEIIGDFVKNLEGAK